MLKECIKDKRSSGVTTALVQCNNSKCSKYNQNQYIGKNVIMTYNKTWMKSVKNEKYMISYKILYFFRYNVYECKQFLYTCLINKKIHCVYLQNHHSPPKQAELQSLDRTLLK